jgi:hypothetical protein
LGRHLSNCRSPRLLCSNFETVACLFILWLASLTVLSSFCFLCQGDTKIASLRRPMTVCFCLAYRSRSQPLASCMTVHLVAAFVLFKSQNRLMCGWDSSSAPASIHVSSSLQQGSSHFFKAKAFKTQAPSDPPFVAPNAIKIQLPA